MTVIETFTKGFSATKMVTCGWFMDGHYEEQAFPVKALNWAVLRSDAPLEGVKGERR